jgi:hypothetical protein
MKLLDDLKERRGYSHLKEKARFGKGFGLVVRQTTKWISESCFGGSSRQRTLLFRHLVLEDQE